MKQAKVWVNNVPAGILTEDDMGYEFRYDINYLKSEDAVAVSLTLPLTDKHTATKCFSRSLTDLSPKDGFLI